jgi:signal transduction histidine kinase
VDGAATGGRTAEQHPGEVAMTDRDARRGGADSALAAQAALDALTAQQAALITLPDRSSAMRAIGERTRQRSGLDVALVGQLEPGDRLVLRHGAGTLTSSLCDLVVPSGLGLGGRVLASGRPSWVSDYVSSPTITHDFDGQVTAERIRGLLAVPVTVDGRVVAVLYAGCRDRTAFGDDAIDELLDVADEAALALDVCRRVEGHTEAALTADRQRLSVALHDSVGAMLFGIGAQVRDLRSVPGAGPDLLDRLGSIETQISAAASALRESLAALSPSRSCPPRWSGRGCSTSRSTPGPARCWSACPGPGAGW